MCRLKSGIILKDQVFVPDYDSHTCMLKELNIKDNKINAKTLFVRAELFPINDNIFSDISTWRFSVDQDILPDWFVREYDKQRMIEAVEKWAKDHIFENIDGLELKGNDKYYLKNCKNVKVYDSCKIIARGNCIIKVYDNSTINAYNSSIIKAFNNSTIYAYDNSIVKSYDDCIVNAQNKCTVNAYDNSIVKSYDDCIVNAQNKCTVNAYDDCTVNAYHNSTIKSIDCKLYGKNLKLFNNAIFINKATKTIFYQNEDYKFVKIGESGERV